MAELPVLGLLSCSTELSEVLDNRVPD